jgi:hypothetical protein
MGLEFSVDAEEVKFFLWDGMSALVLTRYALGEDVSNTH